MLMARRFVGTSGTIYTMTQRNVSEDLKLQQHCNEKAQPRPNVTCIFVVLESMGEDICLL